MYSGSIFCMFLVYELLFLLILNISLCCFFYAGKFLIRVATLCVRIFYVLIPVGYSSTLMICLSLSQHDLMKGTSLSLIRSNDVCEYITS